MQLLFDFGSFLFNNPTSVKDFVYILALTKITLVPKEDKRNLCQTKTVHLNASQLFQGLLHDQGLDATMNFI